MYRTGGAARKTDVVAFRIPSEKLDRLKKEAKLKKVSVNVLANHILDGYFDFQLAANNAGFISMPRKTLHSMIEALRDEEIATLGKDALKSDFEDLVYMTKGKITLQSFLDTFFAWARDANFSYRDEFEEGATTITVHHNMGKRWSLLLKECLAQALQPYSSRITFEVRDDVLIIDITE